MSHPLLRLSCSAAARLAFAAACLLIVAPEVATAGAPLNDAPTEFCRSALARLAEAAESLGYTISAGESGFSAVGEASELRCICPEDQVAIEIVEGDASVSVNFSHARSRFELEIAGEFPEFGRVQHAAILDATTDPLAGSITFTADTSDAAALVEFDLEGEVLVDDGDAAVVNERLAPVLAASLAWRDAHALTLALADLREPGLDMAMAVAVPSPRWWGIKKSMISHAFACGTAAITCTAAAAGFVPAAGGCVNAAGGCALAVACSVVSCLD
jgi:hypothetical protein